MTRNYSKMDFRPNLGQKARNLFMAVWILVLLSLADCYHTIHGGLVVSPPKLETEPPPLVWYHIPSTGAPTKFTLKCNASGDPEKYRWQKNGQFLDIDGYRIKWEKEGQTGSIIFLNPSPTDQGYYQCFVSNIFGTAVSNRVHVQLGVLDHFVRKSVQEVSVHAGDSLTMKCAKPYGVPEPTVFWLFRSEKQSSVIETISRQHITVDGEGNLQFSYVTEHDGRENLLYQCATTSPVMQGEYRVGDEFRLIVKRRAIMPRRAAILWVSPEKVTVTAGEKLKLTCIFSGVPSPNVTWYKEGGDLAVDRLVDFGKVDFGKTIILRDVEPSDAGDYICEVPGQLDHRMTVQVTAAPFWRKNGFPKDVNISEESNARLRCNADGDPKPVIHWYMNGKPIDTLPNPRRMITENGQVMDLVNLNHDVDTGVYQCNASSPLGYVFANAYINVRAHAPKFISPVNQTLRVVLHSTVFMDCVVKAAPPPKIHWVDSQDRKIKNKVGKMKILSNKTLTISEVGFIDSGLYYCNVTNKYGINRALRKLEVYKPTFMLKRLEPAERTLEFPGEAVELECEATGDERLQLNYVWLHNDQPIDFADRHYSLLGENKLRIESSRGKHSGTYSCLAGTIVDSKKTSMKLIVKDVPEAPDITSIECNQRLASIKWNAAFSNFDPLTSYLVEYRTDFKRTLWKVAIKIDESLIKNDTYEAQMILTPWVNYTFRVIAINSHGQGPAGYKDDTTCRTNPSFPYTNPENVRAEGETKDNLIIYWRPMEKESWNGPKFRYVIRYRLADEPNVEWEKLVVEDPQQDRMIVRDQPTFRKYLVRVRALNSVGESIVDPPTIIGFSGEDFPSQPPQGFQVGEKLNATAVKFTWAHVDPGSVNGHFRGYRVQTWSIEKENKKKRAADTNDFVSDVLVGRNDNSAVVCELKPMKSYGSHVLAVNSRYKGPTSTPVFFTMPEGVPTQVTNLDIKAMGSKTIILNWDRPERSFGKLRGYFIYFKDVANDSIYETFVPDPVRHLVHDRARPNSTYEVSVAAQTGGGEGPAVSETVQTFAQERPGQPDFEVEFLNPFSVRVRWIPSLRGMPGSAFYLNYSIADSNHWKRSKLVTLPSRDAELHNLVPNQNYWIVLVAKDENMMTPSKRKIFQTKDDALLERAGESLAGAVWFIAIIGSVAVALVSVIVVCICQTSRGGKYPVKKKELERGHTLDHDEERSFMEYQYGGAYGKEGT